MCFSGDVVFRLLMLLLFIALIVGVLKIWVIPYLASGDARIARTVNLIIGFLIAAFVLYLCWILWECAFGGGLFYPSPRVR
jgi:hypothetical protein